METIEFKVPVVALWTLLLKTILEVTGQVQDPTTSKDPTSSLSYDVHLLQVEVVLPPPP